jgi:hypothetical protein
MHKKFLQVCAFETYAKCFRCFRPSMRRAFLKKAGTKAVGVFDAAAEIDD